MDIVRYTCEFHKKEQSKVLQEQKIVLYCPECAKEHILSIIQTEDRLKEKYAQRHIEKIEHNKQRLIHQLLLSCLVAFYLQLTPWIFAPFFYETQTIQQYVQSVGYTYRWMWTEAWVILISSVLLGLGIYYIQDAIRKIKKLPPLHSKRTYHTKKDQVHAIKRFQQSSRLKKAQIYIKKLHKRFIEEKTTIKPVELMTEYELILYYAKLIQHMAYKDVQIIVPSESFGVAIIAQQHGVRTAMMVCKEPEKLTPEMMNHFATGRAYYDCERAVLMTPTTLCPDGKQFAEELHITCWNMKEKEEQLTYDESEAWKAYLDPYLIKHDRDLKQYAIYETHRLLETYDAT